MARRLPTMGLGLVAALVAAAAAPGAGGAVDRYVDAETGVDTGTACAQANPCDTIAYALANSGAGDEIFIDSGSYPEEVTVGEGRSLTYMDFVAADGTGPAIVDGGAGTAVTVPASGAGAITGLTLRGDSAGVNVGGAVEIDTDRFDDPNAPGSAFGVTGGASGVVIHDSLFTDPAPDSTRGRFGTFLGSGPVIRDSDFVGLNVAIQAFGDGTLVEGNEISETHNLPFAGQSILLSGDGDMTARENEVTDAATASVLGIVVGSGNTLKRNEVTGHQIGVSVISDRTGVTLEGDRIWGNSFDGLSISDTGAAAPVTSVTATNVTIVDNGGVDIRTTASSLTLDSSILELYSFSGSPTCAITFSRANTDPDTDPSGCDDFQTTADPMFVDAATGDFHLQSGSPMLDAGNPAAPPAGAVDFDGDPRAVDATPECTGNVDRRDIGADEFVPDPIDCDPPDTTFVKTPPKKTKKKTVKFKFSADEPASFVCQLDDKAPVSCGSPWEQNVKIGRHKFFVTATDNASNEELEPAKYGFRRVN